MKFKIFEILQFVVPGMCFVDGDEGGGGDSETTAERALEFWDGSAGEKEAGADRSDKNQQQAGEGEAARAGDAGEAKVGDQGAADAQQKEQQGAAITDEQLQADPRYQEVSKFRDEIQPLLDQHQIPDSKELGLQLADASILYQIAAGQAPPSRLLDTMIQTAHWTREQINGVAGDLVGWLTKNGFLKEGQAAAAGDKQFTDPLEAKVNKLEETLAERDRRIEQERVQGQERERQTKIFDSYTQKIGELCAAKGVDKQDAEYYGREVRSLIPQAQFNAIIGRIEKGNFVDVQKLFDQVFSRETARLKRYTETMTKDAERKQKTAPRVPAGGSPPPSKAGEQKRDLRSQEGRTAAAMEEWKR